MLYNIAFQDNIYVLLRQIETLYNGLQLDIDEKLFSAKVSSDIMFFDKTIDSLFEQIYPQSSLHNFIEVLQCLHFCTSKYLELVNFISSNELHCKVSIETGEVVAITSKHKEILTKIEEVIEQNNPAELENEIVSQNELACLLNA